MSGGMNTMGEVYRSPRFNVTDKDFKHIGDYWFEVYGCKDPSKTDSETQYSMRVVEHNPMGVREGRMTPLSEKTVEDAVSLVDSMVEDHKRITGLSDVQDNIMLPNTGCEYISHYYDDSQKMWVVLYEQKPGIHGQAFVDTGIPKPIYGDGKIKCVGLNPFAANVARKSPGKRLDGPLHGPVGSRGLRGDDIEKYLKDADMLDRKIQAEVENMMEILDEETIKAIEKAEMDTQRRMDELDSQLDKAIEWMDGFPSFGDDEDDKGGSI